MPTDTAPDRTRTLWGSPLWSVAAGLFVLFVGGALGMGVSAFADLFDDFDTELPGLTATFFAIPPVAWIAGGLVAAILTLAKDLVIPRANRFTWNAVICIVAFGMLIAVVTAMFLPARELLESAS